MLKTTVIASILVFGMCFQTVYANDSYLALQETQDCLKNQNCDSMNTDAGKAADRQVLEGLGGDTRKKQELYNISAEIMPILVQQADGDPNKMLAILAKAQNDPQNFLKLLPLEVQTRIKNAASALETN